MKSTILIARIIRAIETNGAIGEGANLAEAYDSAIRDVNSRLESVQVAVDSKQFSDAVRQMESEPRLIDEASTLDFNRLPDWEKLCIKRSWVIPAKLDRALLERAIGLTGSTDVVEPFLKMYRKAVRTNDNRLAVQSLRRLSRLDKSQDWKQNLIQAEIAAQRTLIDEFHKAKAAGNEEEKARIALEFSENEWAEEPSGRGVDEIRLFLEQRAAHIREMTGCEDLMLLANGENDNWNLEFTDAILRHVDTLIKDGWDVPEDKAALVKRCRERVERELEELAKAERWRLLNEELYAAIQQQDVQKIRQILSATEFMEREPDGDLGPEARLILKKDYTARRRKKQMTVCVIAVTLLGMFLSAVFYLHQKLLDGKCASEAKRLAILQNGAHAVDRLGEALAKIKKKSPSVYADSRIAVFENIYRTMLEQHVTRTNEIATLLAEVTAFRDGNWNESFDAVTNRMTRIEVLLSKDDEKLESEYVRLSDAWREHCTCVEASRQSVAAAFHKTLISHIKVVANRLRTEVISDELKKELAACRDSLEEWRNVHSSHVPEMISEVDAANKDLDDAEDIQRKLGDAVRMLRESESADVFLERRKDLIDQFRTYPFVSVLTEHPVSSSEAKAMADHSTEEQRRFSKFLESGVTDAAFKAFILDAVLSLQEAPTYYALYGIRWENSDAYFALCKGKPKIEKKSYDSSYLIDGELLDFANDGRMLLQMEKKSQNVRPCFESLVPTEEIKKLVDFSSQKNLNCGRFENEILRIVSLHLKEASSKRYVEDESTGVGNRRWLTKGRYPPSLRVQRIAMYMSWLKEDLNLIPPGSELRRLVDRLESLSQPIKVSGVPDELSWSFQRIDRVRAHNVACAKLLHEMAEKDFVRMYKDARLARTDLKRVASWKFEYAGCVCYDPFHQRWMQDHANRDYYISESVTKDHPLYVIRKEKGSLVLKKAFSPYKNGTEWIVAHGMMAQLLPGDPLIQISSEGKYIDAEGVICNILEKKSSGIAGDIASRIPFVKCEVK